MLQENFAFDFRDRANQTMNSLCETIKSLVLPCTVQSVVDYVDKLFKDVTNSKKGNLSVKFDLDTSWPYVYKVHTYAKKWVFVNLSMMGPKETAASQMLVYYSPTTDDAGNKRYLIQHLSTSIEDIMELDGMPEAALEAHLHDNGVRTEDDAVRLALSDKYYLDFLPTEQFVNAPSSQQFLNELLMPAIKDTPENRARLQIKEPEEEIEFTEEFEEELQKLHELLNSPQADSNPLISSLNLPKLVKSLPIDTPPTESGVYDVLLNDGRPMTLHFDVDKGTWTEFHKDWTDMIDIWYLQK